MASVDNGRYRTAANCSGWMAPLASSRPLSAALALDEIALVLAFR